MEEYGIVLSFIVLCAFGAALLPVVLLFLSWIGGWRRLAMRFPARGRPSGRRFLMRGGKVGLVTYSACLTLYTSAKGLYVSVLWPFRFAHPPIFIPWDSVCNATPSEFFLCGQSVDFDVGSPAVATMRLPREIFEGHNVAV